MPSRTRHTVLYVFDDVETFPMLDSETTARSPVTARVEGQRPDARLRVAWKRGDDDPPVVDVVLALPPLAIDGELEELLLDVSGDAGGCSVSVKVDDGQGQGFSYPLGQVDFTGRCTLAAKVKEPGESWGPQHPDVTTTVVPPLRPYELWLTMSESYQAMDIVLWTLSVTGDVRLAPPGIATRTRRPG